MKRYRITLLLLAIILLCTSTIGVSAFNDVPKDSDYIDALNHLVSLGIISGNGNGDFNPKGYITREQFAKTIVVASGLQDDSEYLKGSSIFSDINPNGWSAGYINVAIEHGFVTGMLDGKFHPEENITFAQACTVLVKALGYSDADISGLWPNNYIGKAKSLGLVDGINLSSNDGIKRWMAVVMLDNLLNTNIKTDRNKTFGDESGLYIECIVLGNSKTLGGLAENQILTNNGIYYLDSNDALLEVGKKYQVKLENDKIVNVFGEVGKYANISVGNAIGTTVSYLENGKSKTLELPDKTTYYHQGEVQKYDNLSDILQVNSSIILFSDKDTSGYEYGVIVDPMYSKPEIALKFDPTLNKIGNIVISDNTKITKDGKIININQIEDLDVAYQVSDIWGKNKYILVTDSKVEGEITNILPNKVSPKTIQIDDVDYDLSDKMDISKINSNGTFSVNNSIIALRGYDGKVIDLVDNGGEDNSNFALVINNYSQISQSIEDLGTKKYYVTLLHVDGTKKTYKLNKNTLGFDGDLVKYQIVSEATDKDDLDTVELEEIDYGDSHEHTINRDERQIDSNYISDNVKIFNMVNDVSGSDSDAYLVKWSSLPNGTIPSGKILYMNKVGDFQDINVIVLNNIFDENYRLGVVQDIKTDSNPNTGTTYTYRILIDGKEYVSHYYDKDIIRGSVVKVKFINDKILSIYDIENPWAQSSKADAIDTSRIKLNSKIYKFDSSISIYFTKSDGTYELKGVNDIKTDEDYSRISVYLNKSYKFGGKAEIIIVN